MQSRCRCGKGEPSPYADVGGASSPAPVRMCGLCAQRAHSHSQQVALLCIVGAVGSFYLMHTMDVPPPLPRPPSPVPPSSPARSAHADGSVRVHMPRTLRKPGPWCAPPLDWLGDRSTLTLSHCEAAVVLPSSCRRPAVGRHGHAGSGVASVPSPLPLVAPLPRNYQEARRRRRSHRRTWQQRLPASTPPWRL